ncbi:cytochrome c-type biogenesis protein [Marinobacterium arenosum]|uniref:cytochrome c-type biogenesis protein n=1 Tax=Marinobacterium arenosum TaxID=2862496 RepID=UPI001C97AB65|nr:cytochrome c-type biogenesis protein [Marinobacterium arenosum]MBY4675981.1 cytochrome c-type biogenesis protein CcmH [Marinobacterium arenosum]
MKRWLMLLALLWPLQGWAAIDTYEFKDEQTRERFRHLTAELRCPKCQNQNLADSDAPIAKDLRNEIHRMLQAGEPDGEIIDFMVTRYGEFVLYRPPLTGSTYLLWYGPFLLLAIGALVVLMISRRKRRADNAEPEETLNPEQRRQLDELLKQDPDKK